MRARYTLVDKVQNADGTVDVYFGAGAMSGVPLVRILEIIRAHINLPSLPGRPGTPEPEAPSPGPRSAESEMTFVLTNVPANQFTDPPGTVYDLLISPAGKPQSAQDVVGPGNR